uniref:Anaphase-promoting complex subunit 4 WD40 domain-containing protein n=1 Tax=Oryza meridionalis TaxID=40149 RepID=A0A0E0D8B7_9ORYZ
MAAEVGIGRATCAAWARRLGGGGEGPARLLVVYARAATASSPPRLDLHAVDAGASAVAADPLVSFVMGQEEDDAPRAIAVHPSGEEFVCGTAKGCRLFKLVTEESSVHLISKDAPTLQSIGPQKYLNLLLDEPKAHKSFRDMDISLESKYLVSTSTDGSARIWKIDEGVPLDEKIECCCFSRDGNKPFLFCTLVKGHNVVTVVLDISNWKRIGYKRLLKKHISALPRSHDGDFCVVDVKKMEVLHLSKKVHLGSPISSIEFCPTERVVISTSHKWGAEVTKLDVPADWKVWQMWLVLSNLFVTSAILFYANVSGLGRLCHFQRLAQEERNFKKEQSLHFQEIDRSFGQGGERRRQRPGGGLASLSNSTIPYLSSFLQPSTLASRTF